MPGNANRRFQGMTFLIAGAAGGIGQAIAERLAADGANLVLADRVQSAAPPGGAAVHVDLDARSPASWQAALKRTIERFGGISGFVHSIGVTGADREVTELTLEEWNEIVEINLTSAFIGLNVLLPSLREQGDGRVVLMASIAGKEGNVGQSAYSAAKAGMIALTKSVAKETAQDGVRVNCLAPTMIEGPLMERMTSRQIESLLAKIPMGRVGRPAEAAALVAWLLSDESTFSTGQCFDLSGGRAVF